MALYQLWALCSDGETFFGFHLYSILQKDIAKISKVPRSFRNVNAVRQ